MPLSRMTVPKSLRDKMTADLGLDGYHGTPEKINTDSVIPVYVMGTAADNYPFQSEHGFSGGQEMTGAEYLQKASCWGAEQIPGTAKPFTIYPNDKSFLLAINHLQGRIDLTVAGRAAVQAYNSNTLRVELLCYDGSTEIPLPWVLAAWKWNVQGQSGRSWVGEFFFNSVYLQEISSPNRIKIFNNASVSVGLIDPRGLILKPRGLYWFELTIQTAVSAGDNLLIPVETSMLINMEGDFYKCNTNILSGLTAPV